MFSGLKKRIESEVGDLSKVIPASLMSRTTTGASSTLSSRHGSVSSLVSEPQSLGPNSVPATLVEGVAQSQPAITPSRSSTSLHSSSVNKLKTMEEKLQAQESDFAWRLSNKDEEIGNLNKTIEILTSQLKSKDSEAHKKLVRVQEDIDSLEGFSQQENAKLKHLLLNKEEELSNHKSEVVVYQGRVRELEERVRGLEGENERIRVGFDKLGRKVVGGSSSSDEAEASVAVLQKQVGELEGKLGELEASKGILEGKVQEAVTAKCLIEEKFRVSAQNEGKLINAKVEEHKSRVLGLERELSDAVSGRAVVDEKLKAALASGANAEAKLQKILNEKVEIEARLRDALEKAKAADVSLNVKESRVSELEAQVRIAVAGKEGVEAKLAESEASYNGLQAKLAEAESVMTAVTSQVRDADAIRKELQQANERFQSSEILIKGLEKEKVDLENQVSQVKSQNCTLLEQLSERNSLLDGRGKELESGRGKVTELEALVLELRRKNQALETSVGELSGSDVSLKELGGRCRELEVEVATVRGDYDRVIRERDTLSGKVKEVEEAQRLASEVLQRENFEKNEVLKLAKEREQSLCRDVEELRRGKAEIEAEVGQLTNANKTLETANHELGSNVSGLSDQLTALLQEKDKAVEERGSAVTELESRVAQLENQLKAVTSQRDQVLVQVRELGNAEANVVGEMKIKVLALEQELAAAKEMHVALDRQVSQTSAAKGSLEVQIVELTCRNSALGEEVNNLKLGSEGLRVTNENTVRDLREELAEKEILIKELREKEEESAAEQRVKDDEHVQRLVAREGELEREVEVLRAQVIESEAMQAALRELEAEKSELLVAQSEMMGRVDELELEVRVLREDDSKGSEVEALRSRVAELEKSAKDKSQQLRQQSHQLSDLRRSLAKELKASSGTTNEDSSSSLPPSHMNGTVPTTTVSPIDSVSVTTDAAAAATLPRYETDVNFMYLRSVLFKYLTSQDPQITSHLTRVVATLLHLTEEETNTLIASSETRSNQHLLSHIIK